MRRLLSHCFLCLVLIFQSTPANGDEAPVKLGVIIPLSGDLATLGTKLREGLEFAAEENGPATFVFEDGAFDKSKALSAYRALRARGITTIIGPLGPDQTLTIAPLAEREGVLLIAVSLCDERFKQFRNVFCIFPHSREQLKPLLEQVSEQGLKHVAYIGEELQSLEPIRQAVVERVTSVGGSLVLDKLMPPGNFDFRSLLGSIRGKEIDLLVVAGGNVRGVLSVFRQAAESGVRPRVKWYLSEHDEQPIKEHAAYLEGAYSLAIPRASEPFIRRFLARYSREPDVYHTLSYDTARGVIRGLRTCRSESLDCVRRELISNPTHDGAIEGFHFDEHQMVSVPLSATVIRDGAILIEPVRSGF